MKTDEEIIASYLQHELPLHLRAAIGRGPTRAELADILTHLVWYAMPLSEVVMPDDDDATIDKAYATIDIKGAPLSPDMDAAIDR